MKRFFVFFMVFVLFITFSNLLQAKKKTYLVDMELDKVIRDPAPGQEPNIIKGESFNDELIQVKWQPKTSGIKYELVNVSGTSLSLIWEESSFFDKDQKKSRIIHSKIKAKNMKDEVPPLDIPSKKKIKDTLFPCDYYFQQQKQQLNRGLDGSMSYGGTYMEWEKKPLYEDSILLYEADDFDFDGYKAKLEKGTFKILLTFRQGEKTYAYHFLFKPVIKEK